MYKYIILLFLLLVTSCSPQKKLYKLLHKHPHLIQVDKNILRDTIIKEATIIDTVYTDIKIIDDERIIRDTVKDIKYEIKWLIRNDTLIDSVEVYIECPPDTVYNTIVEEVRWSDSMIDYVKKTRHDNIIWLILIIIGVLLLNKYK